LNQIFTECWESNRDSLCKQIRIILVDSIGDSAYYDYCTSDTIVPPFIRYDESGDYDFRSEFFSGGSHLYWGSIFGKFLAYVRSFSGGIKNRSGKRAFLLQHLGWCGSF